MYLLYGDNAFLINDYINKIIGENKILDVNVTYYNLDNTSYKKVIMDCYTISLFQETKVIVVKNINIFGTTVKDEAELKEWTNYINKPNPNTILIFVTDSVSQNRKIFKLMQEKGKVIECINSNDINDTIKQMFGKYKIDKDTILLLTSRVGNDLYRLKNEIDKIKTYKDTDMLVTKQDILDLTETNIEADFNKLTQCIIDDDKTEALMIYDEFKKKNEDTLTMLTGLAKKVRLMYQVKELSSRGYSDQDIADILKDNKGHIYYLKKDASKYTSRVLKNYLIKFADIDYQYKTSDIDIDTYFKLFIINK